MTNKPATPKERYLDLCQELIDHVGVMRNFAMTRGDAWLARDELEKIGQLTAELRTLLEELSAD